MQSEKLEKLFVDFILKRVGPNEESENERNSKFIFIKNIIASSISAKYPDYIPYVFTYGSFPIKTYLKEADIDITIILEDKNIHQILLDFSQNNINNTILLLIKDSFENYNKENNQNIFSDMNIIYADIILLKCQINSMSLDISVNNFYGLFKILFMNHIFNQINNRFPRNDNNNNNDNLNDNKLIIFKRTILLIKAWCFYEGNLMGSNIGLMASCALEISVIFMFNLYYKNIKDEVEGFFYFFNLMNSIDLENNIISLFGLISDDKFRDKLFNNENSEKEKDNNINDILNVPFWYIDNTCNNNDYLINLNDIKNFLQKIINSEIKLSISDNKDEKFFKKIFQSKLFNIIDPLDSQNNLGKSINYHSFSKMKKAFEYMTKEIKMINKIKALNDPFLYFNYLLKLFNVTLSMNFIELFINYLNMPKIIVDSEVDENKSNSSILRINKEEIKNFNRLFNIESPPNNNNDNKMKNKNENNHENNHENKKENEEEEDEYDEEEEEESDEEVEEEIDGKNDNNGNENIKYFHEINENEKKKAKQKIKDIKYENYDIIINHEIFNKIIELNKINDSELVFYEKLNNVTNEHYQELDKFLKQFKII